MSRMENSSRVTESQYELEEARRLYNESVKSIDQTRSIIHEKETQNYNGQIKELQQSFKGELGHLKTSLAQQDKTFKDQF